MAVKREPELQAFWESERIYEQLRDSNPGDPFVLHDGPPYANGDLHIGHAMNKILKDMINRFQMLQGRKVCYVPGWDCHGLPIELKVLQSMKSKEREGLTPIALREKAAAFARETVAKQRDSFKRYGVWGEWEEPYLTLQPEYEAAQVGVFGQMVLNGHIYRGRKPVHWSPSSRTALAEAELEYPPKHTSTSIYVGFTVETPSAKLRALSLSLPSESDETGEAKDTKETELRVAVWTTTPWTMPANLAVAVNAELDYAVLSHPSLHHKLIVAKALASSVSSRLGLPEGEEASIVGVLKGADLEGTTYRHPLYDRVSKVVIGGDYITTESGTGLVHTAPGHGQEDYLTGVKYGLELLSPVDDAGCFTSEAGEAFQGLSVLGEGNTAVIDALKTAGALIAAEPYEHKYPYDWRTKKPTIFRATSQWFASVDAFRADALTAIDGVSWMPAVGQNRITAMTESRSDWCISRQRTWGVPIPVFYDRDTDEVLLNQETLAHVQALFEKQGSDAWWKLSEKELLPEPYASEADKWVKGTDTMDVWFDSGASWAAVAKARPKLAYPADLYLEGSDQHRGWFQSSLLTSVAANGIAPYKAVLTHGFVLDEKGYKMSKSLGNVVDPKSVIEGGANQKKEPGYGADVLRLWVASVNYAADVCIGPSIIKQTFESYRKLRNTARFLLGNLHDFEPQSHTVPFDELPQIDRHMLGLLSQLLTEVKAAYSEYQFSRALGLVQQFVVSDLSNFYLDVGKDRLYISAPEEARRRSCQYVISASIEALAVALAPLLPHLAEDIWQNLPYEPKSKSVFQAGWPDLDAPLTDSAEWAAVRALRDEANKCIERARADKLIGASLEAKLVVHVEDEALASALSKWRGEGAAGANGVDELRFFFLTSQVELVSSADEVKERTMYSSRSEEPAATLGITKAGGTKCERCWHYHEDVASSEKYPGVCPRCADSLDLMDFPAVQLEAEPAAA